MNRTINVSQFMEATLRHWRDTPSQGEIPILRKVRMRGAHGVAVVCGDDRLCCQTLQGLIAICEGGALWPITMAGGALDFTSTNPELAAYKAFIVREVGKFLAVKHVPKEAPVDILALGHVDCGFAGINNMSPRAQFESLHTAKLVLDDLFPGPRFEVRTGFHMFWESKHRTYELDVLAALKDLAATSHDQANTKSSPPSDPNRFHYAWAIA